MGKYDNLVTIADFAKTAGVTPGAVNSWLEGSDIVPALIAGNTRLFEVADLEKAESEKGRIGQTIRERGYVHPDQHKALETRYWESVRVSAETQKSLNEALAKLEAAETLINGDTVADYANLSAELDKANERIEEQADTIRQQNGVIVRASVENGEIVKLNDDLHAQISKAKTSHNALLSKYNEAEDKIVRLESTVASFDLNEDTDGNEKLSDAYAEIQQLKEKLKASEAFSNSIITGESA